MSTEKNFWEKYSQLINVSEGEHTLEEVLSAVSGSVNKVWILCNSKNTVYSISFADPNLSGRVLPVIKEYDFNYITRSGSYHSHEYSDVTKYLTVYFKDRSIEEDRTFPLDIRIFDGSAFNNRTSRRPRGVVTSIRKVNTNSTDVINDHVNNHGKVITKIPDSERKIFRLLEKVISRVK